MALDWLTPFQQPLPLPTPPISTLSWSPFALTGTDTKLGSWFQPFQPALPPILLTLQWQQMSVLPRVVTSSIIPSPTSWFQPFQPALPLLPFTYPQRWVVNPFGMTQPEAVHTQWWKPFQPPLPLIRLPLDAVKVSFVAIPSGGPATTLTAAVGVFKLSGSAAVLATAQEALPTFNWSFSYSFSRLVSAFVQIVAYDPVQQAMLVVFVNGSGTLYGPTSTAAVNTTLTLVGSGADPASYLATLPVLDQ